MAKSIKDLRQEKGFRSAREFADALGIATSSMSRYDKQPDTMPLKHAWAMADLLDCSIDEVVGREHVTSGASELQELYDGLLPETRQLMDEFIEFVSAKDRAVCERMQAEEEAKYDRLCQYHERMFHQALYDRAGIGELVEFDGPSDERMAFMLFLRDKAAAKRRPGIEEHCAGFEEEMREGYIDADGTERHWTEEELKSMLAEEFDRMDEEYAMKDEEVIAKVMEAYDRLHARELRNWAAHFGGADSKVVYEYVSMRPPE